MQSECHPCSLKLLSYPNFSTVTMERAQTVSFDSKIYWLQFFVTGKCNMSCSYCSRFGSDSKDMETEEMLKTLEGLLGRDLKKIKFTGGEPTAHPKIVELVKEASIYCEQVSIGTNGTAPLKLYEQLAKSGLKSATISYDGTHQKFAAEALKVLSKNNVRAVAGITVDETNVNTLQQTIDSAIENGASDCTISVSTKANLSGSVFETINNRGLSILTFRLKKAALKATRGACKGKCFMALDSMVFKDGLHYPCQIYMRENGKAIGARQDISKERKEWFLSHEPTNDPICSKYCPDFCIEFNHAASVLQRANVDYKKDN